MLRRAVQELCIVMYNKNTLFQLMVASHGQALYQFKDDEQYEQIHKRESTNNSLSVASLQRISISLTSSNHI